MSDSVETDTKLVLTGNNIDLTDALQEYADKRIGALLGKLGGGIVQECEVHLSVSKNPKVGKMNWLIDWLSQKLLSLDVKAR